MQEYTKAARKPNSKLTKVDTEAGKDVWNMAAYQKLLFIALTPMFAKLKKLLKADNCVKLLNKATGPKADDDMWLLNYLLKKYGKNTGEDFTNFSREEKIGVVLKSMPKLRVLVGILKDTVFLREEKELLFASFPGQMMILYALLKPMYFSVRCIHSGLESKGVAR